MMPRSPSIAEKCKKPLEPSSLPIESEARKDRRSEAFVHARRLLENAMECHRRQVTPIRNPRPIARATVASGRCWIVSSRVSSMVVTAL